MNVDDVLKRHWDYKLPVKPKRIARSLGLDVRRFPMSDIDDRHPDHGLSGKFEMEGKVPVCYYNPDEPKVRQRFTIAHEIGHFVLGHGNSFRDPVSNFSRDGYDYREVQANQFAAQLLMPEIAINYMIQKRNVTRLKELAEIFSVSQVAMDYRLQNLGWY